MRRITFEALLALMDEELHPRLQQMWDQAPAATFVLYENVSGDRTAMICGPTYSCISREQLLTTYPQLGDQTPISYCEKP